MTRQIYAGAGKFGWERRTRSSRRGSKFRSAAISFGVAERGHDAAPAVVNTRDEPHANNELYRRFHVIIGDSNLSLYSIYLKIGTTCLVLQALLNGAPLERVPKVSDPLQTLKTIAGYDVEMVLPRGERAADERGRNPAGYLQLVKEYCPHLDSDWKNVMDAWEQVLDDLDVDPLVNGGPAGLVGEVQD